MPPTYGSLTVRFTVRLRFTYGSLTVRLRFTYGSVTVHLRFTCGSLAGHSVASVVAREVKLVRLKRLPIGPVCFTWAKVPATIIVWGWLGQVVQECRSFLAAESGRLA